MIVVRQVVYCAMCEALDSTVATCVHMNNKIVISVGILSFNVAVNGYVDSQWCWYEFGYTELFVQWILVHVEHLLHQPVCGYALCGVCVFVDLTIW